MNFENKNFILAIVLSMLIIFGWQYFYAAPLQKKLEAQQPATQQTVETPATPGAPAQPAGTVPGAAQSAAASRDEALKTTPRLKIETPSVTGSINLQGAQFDDLHLVKYRETIDP
ncbi:MAG: membrane protein insertase YidC, partial [Alphaproteobacteria bacterium]|nr:membrane protein insertase YidC [Alphaproteobacteria bacterium]